MNDFVVLDDNGDCVGKYRQIREPDVNGSLTVKKLDTDESLADYSVATWHGR